MSRLEGTNPTQEGCLLYCALGRHEKSCAATGPEHDRSLSTSIHKCSPQPTKPLTLVTLFSMEDSQQKQPSTEAAPALSAPTETSNSYAAVIENRAKEVGVAVLHLDSLRIQISQFIEAGRCGMGCTKARNNLHHQLTHPAKTWHFPNETYQTYYALKLANLAVPLHTQVLHNYAAAAGCMCAPHSRHCGQSAPRGVRRRQQRSGGSMGPRSAATILL